MQHSNDDMDNVFRRAGVDYPLYTGAADWNKVAAALKQELPQPVQVQDNRVRYRWLLLLLLLPWVCNYYTDSIQSNREITNAASTADVKNSDSDKIIVPHSNAGTSAGSSETGESGTGRDADLKENSSNSTSPSASNPRIISGHTSGSGLFPARLQTRKRNSGSGAVHQPVSNQQTGQPSTAQNDRGVKETEKAVENSLAEAEKNSLAEAEQINKTNSESRTGAAAEIAKGQSPNTPEQEVEAAEDSLETVPEAVSPQPLLDDVMDKRFYAGLVGGAGVTTVHMQEVKDKGHEVGVVLGYRISEKFSIEAGLLASQKHYYSDGSYLNNKNIYLPPNTKITSVTGICRMWEIPVVVRYNFPGTARSNWFVTAGVSNFIMRQEDYDFDYLYPSGNSAIHSYSYKNESRDFLAVAQVSGGFQFPVKKLFEVRIEPYIQLPLKGAGYGKLHLTGSGLRLGITRSFF